MTIPQENLDSKTFDDMVREAVARIPVYAPQWTDHNRSDPGITLIELFAWLTEMQIYRLNRISNESYIKFLQLAGINLRCSKDPNEKTDKMMWHCDLCDEDLRDNDRALDIVLKDLIEHARGDFRAKRATKRAITSLDYEQLAESTPGVARAKAIPGYHPMIKGYVPNTVSVVVLPKKEASGDKSDLAKLLKEVYKNLDRCRTLATELFVLLPEYAEVSITVDVVKRQESLEKTVKDAVTKALERFLDPQIGGADGKGWPFGRPVYASEVYEAIDDAEGVDYVERIDLNGKGEMEGEELCICVPGHGLVRCKSLNVNVVKGV